MERKQTMNFSIGQVNINWSNAGLKFTFPIADREISLTISAMPDAVEELEVKLNVTKTGGE